MPCCDLDIVCDLDLEDDLDLKYIADLDDTSDIGIDLFAKCDIGEDVLRMRCAYVT